MPAPSPLRVVAWTPTLRWVVNALTWLAYLNLLLVAGLIGLDLVDGAGRAPPLLVLLAVAAGTVVPRLLGAAFRLFCAGTLDVTGEALRLSVGRLELAVPRAAITGLAAWRVPAPGPGISVRLASGRRFERTLELEDGAALAAALGVPFAASRLEAFGRARVRLHRAGARALLFKYGLFAAVPAVLIFRVHQLLTFGGPFGEYRQHGLTAYLRSFALDAGSTLAHLIVFAGVVRLLVEGIALIDGLLLPRRAPETRRAAEWASRLAYYGGIPAALAFAFLR